MNHLHGKSNTGEGGEVMTDWIPQEAIMTDVLQSNR